MSIPTSLIIVVLVAAWLAVLVPMVARRREPVPEAEIDGGTFRVLRRASLSIRRRPKFSRRDELDVDQDYLEVEYDGEPGQVEELHEELLDSDAELDDELDDDEDELDDELADELDEEETDSGYLQSYEQVQYEEVTVAAYRPADDRPDEFDRFEEPRPGRRDASRLSESRLSESRLSESGLSESRRGASRRGGSRRDPLAEVDESALRPVPRRHGRGGFDPDAAEIARAYRYSRRRRISVFLLLATLAFAAAAYVFKPVLWSGAAVFALLLVAYLGYLRRQVRIENEIRQRRMERLRRARQIRPEYHLDRIEEPIAGSAFGRRDVVSQVPPAGYRHGREIVDFEDDDPSFDDLDYYQPITYRRASGQ